MRRETLPAPSDTPVLRKNHRNQGSSACDGAGCAGVLKR